MTRSILISLLSALTALAVAIGTGFAAPASLPMTLSIDSSSVDPRSPGCYGVDETHFRTWAGSLQSGEEFEALPMQPFCDRDGSSFAARVTGKLRGNEMGAEVFRLQLISPEWVVYESYELPGRQHTGLRRGRATCLAGTGTLGFVLEGPWRVLVTNISPRAISDVVVSVSVWWQFPEFQYAYLDPRDWNIYTTEAGCQY